MKMKDEVAAIFEDESFAHLFPERGRAAFSPWPLALITVMQFAEGLSDRQAADAVRARIDWKFALSLELADAGFAASVLCEFRARLIEGGDERLLFDVLLERLRERDLLKARGRQRTDSTRVLASVRDLGRLELVGRTMKRALEALAVSAPEWLRDRARPEWAERYARRFEDHRLPKGGEPRRAEARAIGADGHELLDAIGRQGAPAWLREIPAVEVLRRVWVQQYLRTGGGVLWRESKDGRPPPAIVIESPADPEAHYSRRYGEPRKGYLVHLTETCDQRALNIITHVETAPAPTHDARATPLVHEALEDEDLLPETHLVDTGYPNAKSLIEARGRYGVDLMGPMASNHEWHAREKTGFDLASFEIDWDRKVATCPKGKESVTWRNRVRRGQPVLGIAFSASDCGDCPSRDLCVRRKLGPGRGRPYRELTVSPREHHEALELARERESTPDYAKEYARRRGIEGTISRAVRAHGLRRTRYRGQTKVHLGHVLIATAVNFVRVGEWFSGTPRPSARRSPFVELMEREAA